jgi:hypothetical protein
MLSYAKATLESIFNLVKNQSNYNQIKTLEIALKKIKAPLTL